MSPLMSAYQRWLERAKKLDYDYQCPGEVCGNNKKHGVYFSACSFLLSLRLKGYYGDHAPLRVHLSLFIHPSQLHGNGLFACLAGIDKGSLVGDYYGEIITKAQCNDGRVQDYILGLGRGKYIDGNHPWNLLRFINHGKPGNVFLRIRGTKASFYASRRIEPSEELLYDYGYDPATQDYVYI